MTNINTPAFPNSEDKGLTKMEYALIHGHWEPTKEAIELEVVRDRNKNPYNDSYKPPRRSYEEIIKDLKTKYYSTLLS